MSAREGKSKYREAVEAEWREVPPTKSRVEIIFSLFLGTLFIGGAIFVFLVSGLPDWWELKRYGEQTLVQVIELEFMITPGPVFPGDDYDRLTVTFRDHRNSYQKVMISDFGRFAHDQHINRHNPGSSLPKEAWIVYSRRNPQVTELRDYRRHSWWMAGFSLLLAAAFPGFLYLARQEKKRAQRDALFRRSG